MSVPSDFSVSVLALMIVAFAIGISLWEPVSPVIYGIMLTVVFCVFLPAIALFTSGQSNLSGLVAAALAGFGLLLGALVAVFGPLLHSLRLPAWVPLGIIALTFVASTTIPVLMNAGSVGDPTKLARDLEAICKSEFDYAASSADHVFTCNGPDLPGFANIQWTARDEPESTDKNYAFIDGYQISLQCGPAEHLKQFSIKWVSTSGNEGVVTADSEGHISRRLERRQR